MSAEQRNFSAIIKAKRREKHLTQITLAEKLGVSLAVLQQVEQGKKPSERTKRKLVSFLQS